MNRTWFKMASFLALTMCLLVVLMVGCSRSSSQPSRSSNKTEGGSHTKSQGAMPGSREQRKVSKSPSSDGERQKSVKTSEGEMRQAETDRPVYFDGGLGSIVGLSYDESTDRLMLIGDGDPQAPRFDLKYLTTADRLVREGYGSISFSLDPADPKDPRGKWLKCVWAPGDILPGTAMGRVMFEADWLLKQYSFGLHVGEDGAIAARTCLVPGFKDMYQLGFENFSSTSKETWNRFWIVIGDVKIRSKGNALWVEGVQVSIMTERMFATSNGLESSRGLKDPKAETFVSFFQEHYDEFARESPAFAQLKEIGKVFGLVKWIHARRIPILHLQDDMREGKGEYVSMVSALYHEKQQVIEYDKGNSHVTETRAIHLFGGDVITSKPVELPDNGRAAKLSLAVRKSFAPKRTLPLIPIELEGKQLAGLVLPITRGGKQFWADAKLSAFDPGNRVK